MDSGFAVENVGLVLLSSDGTFRFYKDISKSNSFLELNLGTEDRPSCLMNCEVRFFDLASGVLYWI
jgi:hypothetical protein